MKANIRKSKDRQFLRMRAITGIVIILLICSNAFATLKVLWDISHGVDWGYAPNGSFQTLVENLESEGFSVDTSNSGFLVDDPLNYHVIVVCQGSAADSAYSPAEVKRVTDFVSNGGGLLIMGDNSDCLNEYIQPVASPFGISLGLSSIEPDDTYISTFADHLIFDGVSEIYMRAAGEICAVFPSNEIAWEEETGKALVAAGLYGNGRVVTLGDINLWAETEYYDRADNVLFSINTFEYLAIPEPATLLLLGLGGLIVRSKAVRD